MRIAFLAFLFLFSCSSKPAERASAPSSVPASIPFVAQTPKDMTVYTGPIPGPGQRTIPGTKSDVFFRDFFLSLIDAHPDKKISEDLKRLISNGDITLTFEDIGNAGVVVDLVEAGGREVSGIYMRVNLQILAVGAALENGRRKDVIFTRWMTTISHEYVHVLQVQELLSTQAPGFIAALSLEQRCELTKKNESEAYAETCRVAKSWGLKNHFEFCDSPEAFEKYVLEGVRTQPRLTSCQ